MKSDEQLESIPDGPAGRLQLVRARGREPYKSFYTMIRQAADDMATSLCRDLNADLAPEGCARFIKRVQLKMLSEIASDDFMQQADRLFAGQIEAAKQKAQEELEKAKRERLKQQGNEEGEEAEGE